MEKLRATYFLLFLATLSQTKEMKQIIANFLKNSLLLSYFFIAFPAHSQTYFQSDASVSDDKFGGITSLMSATADNDLEGVQFFAKNNPATINQKNLGGATALHIASRIGNFNIAKILIEKGANVNVIDNEGWTPLMRASLSKSKEIVNLLVNNGANVANVNSFGESAIMHSTFSDCNECLFSVLDRMNHFSDKTLLKNQISEAFIVAKNHNNKDIQIILENSLDKALKSNKDNQSGFNSLESEFNLNDSADKKESSVIIEKNMPLINGFNSKKFKLQQGDGVKKPTFSDSIIDQNSNSQIDEKSKEVDEKVDVEKVEKSIKIILQEADVKEINKPIVKKFIFKKDESTEQENQGDEEIEESLDSIISKSDETEDPLSFDEFKDSSLPVEEKTQKKKGFFERLKFWKSEDEDHDKDLLAIENAKPQKVQKVDSVIPEKIKLEKPRFRLSTEKNR